MSGVPALLVSILVAIPSMTIAADLTTIQCGEPKGVRWIKVGAEPQSFPDGLTGVRPAFIYDPSSPKALYVLFGTSKIYGDVIPEKATRAHLVVATAQLVFAIEATGDEFWAYSLYPDQNVAFFTKHGTHPLAGPYAAAFSSNCSVSGKPLP